MSRSTCKQLGIKNSKVRVEIERILKKWALEQQHRGKPFAVVWDRCKEDIMRFIGKNERKHARKGKEKERQRTAEF